MIMRDLIEQLIWDRKEGVIGAEDSERLEAELSAHPELEELVRAVEETTDLLSEVEQVELPSNLTERIEEAINTAVKPSTGAVEAWKARGNSLVTGWNRVWGFLAGADQIDEGGWSMASSSRKMLVFAAIGVIAVAVGVFVFTSDYPPSTEDAAGTIGAADRYRAEQITESDVVLGGSAAFDISGLTDKEKAEVFDNAVDAARGDAMERIGLARGADVGRMDAAAKAEALGRVIDAARKDGLNRLDLGRIDLGRMDVQAKAEALGRAVDAARRDALGRLDLNRLDVQRMDVAAKAEALGRVIEAARGDALNRLDLGRIDLGRMDVQARADAFERAVGLARGDVLERADLKRGDVARMDAQMKADALNRLVDAARGDALNRLDLGRRLDAGRIDAQARDADLGRQLDNDG
jgi:hypothetical protein